MCFHILSSQSNVNIDKTYKKHLLKLKNVSSDVNSIKINYAVFDPNNEYSEIFVSIKNGDEKIKEALRRFIKMRFANNKPLNTEIFQMLVDQLRELAFDDDDRLHIINTAVMNGWNSFRKVEKPPKILRPKNDDEVVIKRREDFSEEKLIALMRKLRGEAGEA